MKKSGLADSPFFSASPPPTPVQPPAVTQEPQQIERNSERKSERTDIRSDKRTENRTVSLPTRRSTRRYSFEFYEDQIVTLKRLKYEAEMAGERLSLSDIVREALEQYLSKQSS